MSDLSFGLYITVAGMGVVFAILGILWGLLSLLTKFDRPEAPEVAATPAVAPRPVVVADDRDSRLTAAIAIAVLAHRSMRRMQAAPEMRMTWPGSQIYASRWLAAGRTRQTRGWMGKR